MPSRFSIDELNDLSDSELIEILKRFHVERNGGKEPKPRKKRSMPYREYFGDMYLDPEDKEKRIKMAKELEHVFLFLFATMVTLGEAVENIPFSMLYQNIENKYWAVVEKYISSDGGGFTPRRLSEESRRALENSIRDYISRQTREIVDATTDNFGDDYFTSEDRAEVISENQTNGVENNADMFEAVDYGFTHKTWVTMNDNRVRDTHAEVDGVVLPIEEPFQVGDSELLFPMDISLGASAEEVVNCRCTVEYSNEGEGEYDESGSHG